MEPTTFKVEERARSRAGQHIVKVSGPIRYGMLKLLQRGIQAASAGASILDLSGCPA